MIKLLVYNYHKITYINNKYIIITKTVCKEKNCKIEICTRNITPKNSLIIPAIANYKIHIIKNITSKIPSSTPGVLIDPFSNYSQQPKPQYAVIESQPAQVSPQDLRVHPQSTNYLQDSNHHKVISNSSNAEHSNPKT